MKRLTCAIEIETLAGPGGPDVHQCDMPAAWRMTVWEGINVTSANVYCSDHIDAQVELAIAGDHTRQIMLTWIS